MLQLLSEAAEAGRPAVALSGRRVAELLGYEPPAAVWAERAEDWAARGWAVHAGAGVVTFTPLVRAAGGGEVPDPVDVRVQMSWRRPAEVSPGPGIVRIVHGEQVSFVDSADVCSCDGGTESGGEVMVARFAAVSVAGRTAECDLADPRVRRLALAAAGLWTGEPQAAPVEHMGGGSGI